MTCEGGGGGGVIHKGENQVTLPVCCTLSGILHFIKSKSRSWGGGRQIFIYTICNPYL